MNPIRAILRILGTISNEMHIPGRSTTFASSQVAYTPVISVCSQGGIQDHIILVNCRSTPLPQGRRTESSKTIAPKPCPRNTKIFPANLPQPCATRYTLRQSLPHVLNFPSWDSEMLWVCGVVAKMDYLACACGCCHTLVMGWQWRGKGGTVLGRRDLSTRYV